MEGMKRPNNNKSPSSPPSLAMHKGSQIISKPAKPKIRIIHIFAPEIIKTDAANFRELVQRLTGKPTSEMDHTSSSSSQKVKPSLKIHGHHGDRDHVSTNHHDDQGMFIKEEEEDDQEIMFFGHGGGDHHHMKNNAKKKFPQPVSSPSSISDVSGGGSEGGFLGAFADLEHGFMQELSGSGGDFPVLSCFSGGSSSSSHMDAFGDTL